MAQVSLLQIPYPLLDVHGKFTCDINKALDTPRRYQQKAKTASTPAITIIIVMMYMGDHAGAELHDDIILKFSTSMMKMLALCAVHVSQRHV